MSDRKLRSRIIRLAHAKPELRPHLLPLVASKRAQEVDAVEALRGYLDRQETGETVFLSDLPKLPEFGGLTVYDVQHAAEALQREGIVAYDGANIISRSAPSQRTVGWGEGTRR